MRSLKLSSAKGLALSLSKGFTLIEILVVVALISLIAGMGIIIGFDTIARSSVHEERDLLVSLLQEERAKAIANVDEKEHGVRLDPTEYVLFSVDAGGTFDYSDTENIYVERNSAIQVDADYDILYFEQLSGELRDGANTIELSDGAQSQTIELNAKGRIGW